MRQQTETQQWWQVCPKAQGAHLQAQAAPAEAQPAAAELPGCVTVTTCHTSPIPRGPQGWQPVRAGLSSTNSQGIPSTEAALSPPQQLPLLCF